MVMKLWELYRLKKGIIVLKIAKSQLTVMNIWVNLLAEQIMCQIKCKVSDGGSVTNTREIVIEREVYKY